MNPLFVFTLQFLSSAFFAWLIIKKYLLSDFKTKQLQKILFPLIAVHILRTIGLIYLATDQIGIDSSLPKAFLYATAYGDLAAAALAMIALCALQKNSSRAYTWVWVFNIVGCADLLLALGNGTHIRFFTYDVGIAWFLPAFIVPMLLITHLIIFHLLTKHPDRKTLR